jgi:hypothetical protein
MMILHDYELFLYAAVGGSILGLVLAVTRPHMTGRATIVFTMLYYFLFTGFVNIRRFLVDGDPFDDNALLGFTRAVTFAVAATAVVCAFRIWRRRRLQAYIQKLEDGMPDTSIIGPDDYDVREELRKCRERWEQHQQESHLN